MSQKQGDRTQDISERKHLANPNYNSIYLGKCFTRNGLTEIRLKPNPTRLISQFKSENFRGVTTCQTN